jgi:hypothetical protein
VLFAADRVLCVGDLGYTPDPTSIGGPHPLIDYRGGGSLNGWIKRLDTITAGTDYDVVVPGHRGLATKADLVTYRDGLAQLRDHVTAYLHDGTKTADDLKAFLVKDEHWPDPGLAMTLSWPGIYTEFKP